MRYALCASGSGEPQDAPDAPLQDVPSEDDANAASNTRGHASRHTTALPNPNKNSRAIPSPTNNKAPNRTCSNCSGKRMHTPRRHTHPNKWRSARSTNPNTAGYLRPRRWSGCRNAKCAWNIRNRPPNPTLPARPLPCCPHLPMNLQPHRWPRFPGGCTRPHHVPRRSHTPVLHLAAGHRLHYPPHAAAHT